ncbi:hypothetical protein ACGF4C_37835 [Streptomyces sp. NPDC048197]|uniref:hypothetical protein n=1 Tax=Streptomyces sp. NPDC048197 TaxID=3365511 RepID=UPI0037180A2C
MLDRLRVPLGSLLADWPADPALKLVLQGDVIQQADVACPDPRTLSSAAPFWAQPWMRVGQGEPGRVSETAGGGQRRISTVRAGCCPWPAGPPKRSRPGGCVTTC